MTTGKRPSPGGWYKVPVSGKAFSSALAPDKGMVTISSLRSGSNSRALPIAASHESSCAAAGHATAIDRNKSSSGRWQRIDRHDP
jgi:hypothetical protein